MKLTKAFLKGFKEGLKPINWTKKDIVLINVCFILGLLYADTRDFILSLFN